MFSFYLESREKRERVGIYVFSTIRIRKCMGCNKSVDILRYQNVLAALLTTSILCVFNKPVQVHFADLLSTGMLQVVSTSYIKSANE